MRIKGLFRRFNADETGAVVIIVALALTMMLALLAVGIDLGSLYFRQKTLQSRADMAAVSAVLNLHDEAENGGPAPYLDAARKTVTGNALTSGALTRVDVGRYDYDAAVSAEDRFTAGDLSDEGVNAAQAELADTAPLFFARSFLNTDSTEITAEATAAQFDFASFSLGSRLLSVNTGESVLDGLLGGALGTEVDLDFLDYQALATANIDLLTFTDALGNRIGATVGDYDTILTSDIDLADIAGAILDTGAVSEPTAVLTTIISTATSKTLNGSELIGIEGDSVALQLEDILGETHVNALDLLKASLDIFNEDNVIDVDGVNLGIDDVTRVDLDLVVGEREAHSGWITLGERGATIHTAQVRLKLDLELEPTLLSGLGTGVSVLSLKLPLYVEIASATATLTDLNCEAQDPNDTVATFDTGFDPFVGTTGPNIVEMFIGKFDPSVFEDITTPLDESDLKPADFLDVSLRVLVIEVDIFTLQLQSHAESGVSLQPSVSFLVSDINGTPKTISSGSILSSTVGSLLEPDNLHVSINDGELPSSVDALPGKLDSVLLTPLDALLDGLLNTLGIGIGQGDLTLDGVSCGKVVLVH